MIKRFFIAITFLCAAAPSFAMNPEHITLASSDGRAFKISRRAAACSQTLRDLVDAGVGNAIELPNIDGATLEKITQLLTSLNNLMIYNSQASPEKRLYIPRRFQSRVNKIVAGATNREIGELFRAAYYLEVPIILNGIAAVLADRLYEDCDSFDGAPEGQRRWQYLGTASRQKLIAQQLAKNEFGELPAVAGLYALKQIAIRKYASGGIKREYSIADYIDDNDKPYLEEALFEPGAKVLALNNKKLTSIYGLNSIEQKEEVKALSLAHNSLFGCPFDVQPELMPFREYKNLVALDLSFNQLHIMPTHFLASAPYLRVLELNNNNLAHLPADLFLHTPNLSELDLSNNQLEDLFPDLVCPLAQLTFLNVENNQLHRAADGISDVLALLAQLKELKVGGNKLSDEERERIKGVLPSTVEMDI